ncbi:cytoplasmic protein [Streptococcus pseudoporcinus]|uniref:Cytoplasmic protein n=1 Tax=Streptococcus pseudoporcinus TaxID=361101 RepID=A0A4U9Z6Y4_9STRE|nr:MmcQ/YjbR family DNA-binding protein [Streptococcus pseudoporcinus]VTS34864.1 cytoplasmic protein [Streptococcus pseudoporcinus]
MTIEENVFRKRQIQLDRLVPFGFNQDQDGSFSYHADIMDGAFTVQVVVEAEGQLSSRVIDNDMKEDYLAIHVEKMVPSYVGKVQTAYQAVLEEISEACCILFPFQSDQMNRLNQRLVDNFSDSLDQPFDNHFDTYSYRVGGKWYAVIFPLALNKLEGIAEDYKNQTAEVINLKVKPRELDTLLSQNGIYPAYHMSKKSWISIILDDSLSDEVIWKLILASRALVESPLLKRFKGPDFWIIPANLNYYDIDSEFAASTDILWTQKASIKIGDYVFIYITAPAKAIRYVCRVLEVNITNEDFRPRKDIKTLMHLQLIEKFADDQLPLEVLQEHGVKSVRGPRRLTPQFIAFLQEKGYLKED